jgi:hypothetical protein
MRNESKTTDLTPDRRLGPLDSLMRAAEPLEELTAGEREQIKHRLQDELAARHRRPSVVRLSTALAALGLLLAGGAAAAGRLGLIHWPSANPSPVGSESAAGQTPRRPMRVRPKAAVTATPMATVSVQDAPAPAAPALSVPPLAARALAPPSPQPVARAAGPARLAPAHSSQATRDVRTSPATPVPAPGTAASGPSVHREPLLAPSSSAIVPPPAPALVPPSPRPAVGPALAMSTPARSTVRAASPAATKGQDLLDQALRSLRSQHDPRTALDLLARHAAQFPQSPLASERSQLEVEALLALGRHDEALLRLDGMSLGNIPRRAERHVVRGELRARARRWGEAGADFDQALAHVMGISIWHERALWGRAMVRSHAGDKTGARADLQLYLQTYPQGRFAPEAARVLAAE